MGRTKYSVNIIKQTEKNSKIEVYEEIDAEEVEVRSDNPYMDFFNRETLVR